MKPLYLLCFSVAEKVYGRYNTDGLQLEGTPIRVVLLYPITKRIDTSTKLECNKICLKVCHLVFFYLLKLIFIKMRTQNAVKY